MKVYFRAKDGNKFTKNPSRKVMVDVDFDELINYNEIVHQSHTGIKEYLKSALIQEYRAYEFQYLVDGEWAIDGDNTYKDEYIKERWPEILTFREEAKKREFYSDYDQVESYYLIKDASTLIVQVFTNLVLGVIFTFLGALTLPMFSPRFRNKLVATHLMMINSKKYAKLMLSIEKQNLIAFIIWIFSGILVYFYYTDNSLLLFVIAFIIINLIIRFSRLTKE